MQEQRESARPSIVPRVAVPISSAPEDTGLEIRHFQAHDILSQAVPDSVALAWTYARHGQDVALRSHANPGLLIVLQGKAELVGAAPRHVEQGDVITVPANQAYGFTNVGRQGLQALHVAFRADTDVGSAGVLTCEELVAYNEKRARAALKSPFFRLLHSSTLNAESRRKVMREALRVFSDAFQVMLFSRQALCRDRAYQSVFDEHMQEELGHNKLLDVTGDPRVTSDPILNATSAWFCHQMLVLDNAGKAIVHLVLETAGHHFHTLATSVFASDRSSRYFVTHAQDDERHKELAMHLLRGQHPLAYARLYKVLEESWDMFEAMSSRIAKLVDQQGTSV